VVNIQPSPQRRWNADLGERLLSSQSRESNFDERPSARPPSPDPGQNPPLSDTAGAADEAAEAAGLRYVTSAAPGICRKRSGRGFRYVDAEGAAITDPELLDRIRLLAIPPAWREVWICADPRGHLQSLGKDARGRTQYLYHPDFRAVRDRAKFDHMLDFARTLPAIRARAAADMARPGLGRDKVLATVAYLLEASMIRVGSRDYAAVNRSYGLTTLRNRHVSLEGPEVRFRFKGKSGRDWRVSVRDRRAARIVRNLQELPGHLLFQYVDDEEEIRAVSSADVNAYLREITGADVTAKDFRTWRARSSRRSPSPLAAETLQSQASAAPPR
jgi:DNA topoisomerase I